MKVTLPTRQFLQLQSMHLGDALLLHHILKIRDIYRIMVAVILTYFPESRSPADISHSRLYT
jgi:hypothetical protein